MSVGDAVRGLCGRTTGVNELLDIMCGAGEAMRSREGRGGSVHAREDIARVGTVNEIEGPSATGAKGSGEVEAELDAECGAGTVRLLEYGDKSTGDPQRMKLSGDWAFTRLKSMSSGSGLCNVPVGVGREGEGEGEQHGRVV